MQDAGWQEWCITEVRGTSVYYSAVFETSGRPQRGLTMLIASEQARNILIQLSVY